ncbi:hypothetical protein [Faecalibacterium langellae]|uniref:Uncharacterized protein n=1 Tax=Faecalibacterium langellae TaxID=3435293 RepID=A0ACC9D221_9FIRM|nr:hypothetical protein [Faecalibacterium prausnitzii]PDX61964.1 hypothetical protein CGS49_02645 [Faecalibacterium prausnitzii]
MADRMKNRNFIPEDFTLSLALVDALPVLFFSCSMVLIAGRFASILFCLGAAVIVLASCGKVLWKLLLSLRKQNVPWLNRYFIPCQISGFVLILLSLVLHLRTIRWSSVLARLTHFPSVIFFLLWLCGMGCMSWYRKNRFDNSLKANWTAQLINTAAQGALLLGILFL